MSVDEAIEKFSSLTAHAQLRVLARHAWELTTVARGTYVAGTEETADQPRIRLINEVQHRVIAQIDRLASGDPDRFPDDVIVRMAVDDGDGEMLNGFGRALRVCS